MEKALAGYSAAQRKRGGMYCTYRSLHVHCIVPIHYPLLLYMARLSSAVYVSFNFRCMACKATCIVIRHVRRNVQVASRQVLSRHSRVN
jgi:hypothetical protein